MIDLHVLVRAMQYVPVAMSAQQDYFAMTKEYTHIQNPLTRPVICRDCWYIESTDDLRQHFNDNSVIERQDLGGADAGNGNGGGDDGNGGGDDDDRGGQRVSPSTAGAATIEDIQRKPT